MTAAFLKNAAFSHWAIKMGTGNLNVHHFFVSHFIHASYRNTCPMTKTFEFLNLKVNSVWLFVCKEYFQQV